MSASPGPRLGAWLKRARRAAGLSQEALAERAGLSVSSISKLERGCRHRPRQETVQLLCTALELSPEQQAAVQQLMQRPRAPLPPLTPPADAPAEAAGPPQEAPALPQRPVLTTGVLRQGCDPLLPPLPHVPTGLIGREALLAQLKARLLAGELLVLSALQGLPGVGKTALALALAHDAEVRAHFADGILWAGLGQRPQVQETLARWGGLLGLAPEQATRLATSQEWAAALRSAIGERRLLLVLDDAWQVEAVLACQVGGAGCSYVVTTRRPDLALQVAGAELTTVPELPEEAGLALLEQFAPQVVKAEPEAARALVKAVGGLPLGLVLLGHALRLEAYSGQPRRVHAALERLRQRAARLQVGQPQRPLHPHPSLAPQTPLSLQASIGVSVASVSDPAAQMLRALAVFPPKPNTFSEEAALAVSGEGAETLDRLVDAGLVESAGPGRYRLHQTIADYAWVQGRPAGVEGRLVAYYAAWVVQHQRDYAILDLELLNIQTALDAAYEYQMYAPLMQGVIAWWPSLHTRGLYALAERHLLHALEGARVREDGPGLVTLLLDLAQLCNNNAEYPRAIGYGEEGLALARHHGLHAPIAALLHELGAIAHKRGEYAQAVAYLGAGLAHARQTGVQEYLVPLLSSLGVVAFKQGNYASAESSYQEALQVARHHKLRGPLAGLLDSLGSLYRTYGDERQAEVYYREALALARQLGLQGRLMMLLGNVGGMLSMRGAFTEAKAYLQEGIALARQLGHRERLPFLLDNLGFAVSEQGDHTQAISYLREGLALARQIGYREIIGVLLTNLGTALMKAGDTEEAEASFQEGQAVAQETQHPLLRAMNLTEWGELHLRLGQLERAATAFQVARHLATELGSQVQLATAAFGLARLAAAAGDVASAWQQGQESLRLFEQLGDYRAGVVHHWLEQVPHPGAAPSEEWPVEARARRNGRAHQRHGPTHAPER